jgi:hypothetical protein
MTTVIFHALAKIGHILLSLVPLRGTGRISRASFSNSAVQTGASAGFAAAQKPSPLAFQALGSGQPDQPLASDFP